MTLFDKLIEELFKNRHNIEYNLYEEPIFVSGIGYVDDETISVDIDATRTQGYHSFDWDSEHSLYRTQIHISPEEYNGKLYLETDTDFIPCGYYSLETILFFVKKYC